MANFECRMSKLSDSITQKTQETQRTREPGSGLVEQSIGRGVNWGILATGRQGDGGKRTGGRWQLAAGSRQEGEPRSRGPRREPSCQSVNTDRSLRARSLHLPRSPRGPAHGSVLPPLLTRCEIPIECIRVKAEPCKILFAIAAHLLDNPALAMGSRSCKLFRRIQGQGHSEGSPGESNLA